MLRIAGYHFAHRNWTEAIQAYDEYVKLFRNGAVPYATLQAARASFLAYRGAAFDDAPLLDAEQRFKIFREHYPAQAAKAEVDRSLTDIRDLRAEGAHDGGVLSAHGATAGAGLLLSTGDRSVPAGALGPTRPAEARAAGRSFPSSAPAPQPQTRPFTPPPEEKPPQPTTTQAATGPATRPTTGTATTTSNPSTKPIRIEDLVPTTQGAATKPATRPYPTTQPATDAAAQPTTTPTSGGSK